MRVRLRCPTTRPSASGGRAEANRLPGAKQVLSHAEAYERAVELDASPKKGTQREDTGEDFVAKLTAVIDSGNPDTSLLFAHRGVILRILGRCQEGEADLEAANEARPSAFSTWWLVLRHGRTNRTHDVARVCAHATSISTAPASRAVWPKATASSASERREANPASPLVGPSPLSSFPTPR